MSHFTFTLRTVTTGVIAGEVQDHGSIDNERIIKTVIDLLEGGAEAFEARRRRYSLDGENASIA